MINIEEKKDELKRAMECVQAEYAILEKAGEILEGKSLTVEDLSAVRALINSVRVGTRVAAGDTPEKVYQRRRGARKSVCMAVKDHAKTLEELSQELTWTRLATLAVVKPMLKAGMVKVLGDDKITLTVKGQRQVKWFLAHPERFNFKGAKGKDKSQEVVTSHAVAA